MAGISTSTSTSNGPTNGPLQPTNYPALTTLITVFFFWGFIAAGNSIFIPFCKNKFHLDQFQSQLVDFAFYLAYYIGALILFIISTFLGKDLVGSWGYKKSIIYGLLFSAIGAAIMILAVQGNTFTGMLFGLFVVALGFSLQQTGAQPFAILLGDPSTGNTRVNLGGGINSLGTTIGPLVVGFALFGSSVAVKDDMINQLPISKVITLYICVGLLFVAAAALFGTSKKVPAGKIDEKLENAPKALTAMLIITFLLTAFFVPVFNSYKSTDALNIEKLQSDSKTLSSKILDLKSSNSSGINAELQTEIANSESQLTTLNTSISDIKKPLEKSRLNWLLLALATIVLGLPLCNIMAQKSQTGWGAMQYPQLVYGMLAIFVYVGVEVAIGSNLGELLKKPEFGGYESSAIAPFVALYWGSLMIGRWTGAVAALSVSDSTKGILKIVMPFVAFGVVLLFTSLAGHQISNLYGYVVFVAIQLIVAYISKDKPAKTLLYFSIFGIASIALGLFTSGMISIFSLLAGGLVCSIMWPSIFTLAISGLGKYTSQASAFLIMMILGGAIIPPIQGKLADIIGIHQSFIIALLCFVYLAAYAFIAKSALRNQGLSFE